MQNPPIILLLEDEPIIAEAIRLMLFDVGCRVLSATDKQEAVALCAAHAPDCALLNFHHTALPDGMALAQVLQAQQPIKVFFVTGARRSDLALSSHFDPAHPVLFKPFTRQQLRRVLADLLP